MRKIRMRVAAFVGDRWHQVGDVAEVEDHRAQHLVRLCHAENYVELPPAEKAVAPKPAAEKATARK